MNYGTGWRDDPQTVDRHLNAMNDQRGDPRFHVKAAHLFAQDDNADILYWEIEQKLLNKLMPTMNQLQVGSCEGHGNARAAQDAILAAAASLAPTDDGTPTSWPGMEVSPEITYANGRDMDNYHGGDGGTGAGTAKGLTDVGIGMRGKYAAYDFTIGYPENQQAVRSLASRTVPSDIKASCGLHKMKDAALIQTGADAWTALGFLKPIAISGMISRPMKRQANGMCPATGLNWSHCQCLRGRATLKGGRRVVPYSNSWGDYLGSENNTVELESGRTIILPPGHYFAELDDVEKDLKRRDSFAFSHAHGWPATRIDWNTILNG